MRDLRGGHTSGDVSVDRLPQVSDRPGAGDLAWHAVLADDIPADEPEVVTRAEIFDLIAQGAFAEWQNYLTDTLMARYDIRKKETPDVV